MKMMISFLLALTLLFTSPAVHAQDEQPMIGQPAPAFSLPGLDGKTYTLEEQRGRYVVIHFAATWCPFCNAEAPYLEQLYKDYREKGVQVFIIDVKEGADRVKKSFEKFNFTFPVLLDHDGAVSASYAPEGVLPDLGRDEVPLASNLIIDQTGRILFYSLLNSANFDAKLVKLREKLDELVSVSAKP